MLTVRLRREISWRGAYRDFRNNGRNGRNGVKIAAGDAAKNPEVITFASLSLSLCVCLRFSEALARATAIFEYNRGHLAQAQGPIKPLK